MTKTQHDEVKIKDMLHIKHLKSKIAIDLLKKSMIRFKTLTHPKNKQETVWSKAFLSLVNYFGHTETLIDDTNSTWEKLLKNINRLTNKEIFQVIINSLIDLEKQQVYVSNQNGFYIVIDGQANYENTESFIHNGEDFVNYEKFKSFISESLKILKTASELIGEKYAFYFKISDDLNGTYFPRCLISIGKAKGNSIEMENIRIALDLPLTMENLLQTTETLQIDDDSDALDSDFHTVTKIIKSKMLKDSLEFSLNKKSNSTGRAIKI